jgi:cobalt/nickel transport system ATP-binding protein
MCSNDRSIDGNMNAGADRPTSGDFAIEVVDLRFSYPNGHVALGGVSFGVRGAESVALIGANGTGKSTLLLCIVGILRGSGSVRVHGMEADPDNIASIRRRVGFVFQNPEHQLFSSSVLDDVVFGPLNLGLSKKDALARAEEALAELNMTDFKHRVPQHLSQGEKKKIALATALVMKPSVLLLDEPTAGLDPRSSTQLIDVLFRLKDEGKTMLVATHDMHLAEELADRVIVLGESRAVVRQGSPAEILTDLDFLAGNNLIHEHSHFHERARHAHPHSHTHREGRHSHPHQEE